MREIALAVANRITEYLEIPNYLLVKYKQFSQGEKVYDSEEKYWHDLLGPIFYKKPYRNPKTLVGDIVLLRNFQLSPWFPYNPGLYWTYDGYESRQFNSRRFKYTENLGLHFEPRQKRSFVTEGGFGTLRTRTKNRLSIYGATTSGNINAAIPILISSNVKSNLLRFSKKSPLIEVDLRGFVAPIPFTYLPYFHRRHIPRVCVVVNSILNVKKYISDFSLSASAWTIYHNPNGRREKRYGYTYANFNPIDESSIVKASDWIENYIFDYTKGKGIPITDYDELTPRFNTAVVPLEQVMQGNIDYDALNSLFGGANFRQQCAYR